MWASKMAEEVSKGDKLSVPGLHMVGNQVPQAVLGLPPWSCGTYTTSIPNPCPHPTKPSTAIKTMSIPYISFFSLPQVTIFKFYK